MRTFAFANLINVRDVGMIECRCCLGLLDKAPHAIRGDRKVARQNLQRDWTPQLGVLGKVDLTHTTSAQ